MKKRQMIFTVLALAALALILTGCSTGTITKTVEQVDKSTRIITYTEPGDTEDINYSTYELEYIKDDNMYTVWFSENLRPSLNYLRAHTKPSDVILTWWDNGHLIRGYAKRETIIYAPNREILETVSGGKWDQNKLGEYASKDDLTNVAYALLADSPKITAGIMRRYKSNYVYVTKIDQKKIAGMVQLMGEDINNYQDELGDPKPSILHKTLFKMADGWTVDGFTKLYEDDYAFIYKLNS
ncbi:hypothetical protein KY363_03225 [Candidatus Woesearchaeota archaeon]|nr:hypothetical protein [Candidatus Woesearchaeota archaeon]